ncbi:MAG: PilZ domain-containing protein [Treponema sp.]|jgi:hypothetical protein|nr:PilZ domain-containing protein [Treponema sp.]
MATPVKHIEKEFILKVVYDDQIPIVHFQNRSKYTFVLEQPALKQLFLKADRYPDQLRIGKKTEMMFDFRGQVITFNIEITDIRNERVVAAVPKFLYKNLDRSYSRVALPQDLQVQFTFLGNQCSLAFPKITQYESMEVGAFLRQTDPKNLNGLIQQMATWIKEYADDYKLVFFKDVKPSSAEEQILAETGKVFFLPSTLGGLPKEDPYPKKRLITEEMFKRYLESNGEGLSQTGEIISRFIRSKFEGGVFSDAWVPVIFQEYVVGYIHIWINQKNRPLLNYKVIDTLLQFSKILAFSLKENGFFEKGRITNEPFVGKVIDISVSGLLFVCPRSKLTLALLQESELVIKLVSPKRTINTNVAIVRQYQDASMNYYGCRFLDILPEDKRFLFEFIYGRPVTDADVLFFAGQV